MQASGSQIVFPPIESPNFHCGHCLCPVWSCSCEGLGHGKDYVIVGLPVLPSQPTPVERLVRWASITSVHPGTGHFDARRFVRDMVDRNMLFTLSLERSRLSHMAEDHARKLGEPSEAARLPALFAAGRLDGTPAAQLAALQAMCEGAMEKLLLCHWAGMSPLEVALCQNAFQTSDPSRYPLGDPGLQLVYDVIGVLTTVHRWAFSTRGWHLRLEAPEQSGLAAAAAGLGGSGCSTPHGWHAADSPHHFVPSHSSGDLKHSMSRDTSSQHLREESMPSTPM